MRTDFERCYVTGRAGVAVLTLNHPETVNAASFSMMQGCLKAMDLIEADSALRASARWPRTFSSFGYCCHRA